LALTSQIPEPMVPHPTTPTFAISMANLSSSVGR
jgi:hypothetical protein